jgi:hypothetical protein
VSNGRRLHVIPTGNDAWSRRFRDVLGEIIGDLGGPDNLTEGQRQLARRAATLSLECERMEVRTLSGRSIFEEMSGSNGPSPLGILQEASKILHAMARHGIRGTRVAAVAELPREEQDRIADLLTRAADIAAKAHVAAGCNIDLELYGMLCDRLNRVFVRLGLERVARDVTSLPEYLEAAAQQVPQELPKEE